MLLAIATHAQPPTQSVNVQVVATPPYSTFLNDYQTGSNLMVTLLQRDLTLPQLQVYLNLELEGAGIRLKTLPTFRPSAYIALDPGTPVTLTNADLVEYLSLNNLYTEGISKESFLATGQQLPQGLYKLKVSVVNALTGTSISLQGFTLMGIYKGQPPIINLPFNNKIIPANDLQTFTIQWTNRNSAAFNASNPASYRLQIWELPETALDPNVIVGSNYPTLFDEYFTNTSYQYGPANPALIPGMSYAVRVQAVDASGRDLFSNNGYSQVVRFTYGGGCIAPNNVTAKAEGSNIVLNWTAVGTKGYTVKYRRVDQVDTTFEDVLLNSLTIRNLPPNAQYFFQVATLCDGNKLSAYSKPLSIYTLPEDANNLANCGAKAPRVNLNNKNLLPILKVGDVFTSYDFKVKVTRIDRSDPNGFFGEGTTEVKMLGNLNTVVTFNGIRINTDYVQLDGRVDFQQKPYVFSDERLNAFADDLKKSTQDNDVPTTAFPTDIEISGTVTGIVLSGDRKSNTVTYTDEKGKTQTKTLAVGKDYKITDKKGDTYLIAKDGSVTKQEKSTAKKVDDAPSGNGGPSTTLYFGDSSLTVSFMPHPDQHLGFDDPLSKRAPESEYEHILDAKGNKYFVPWMSVAAGSTGLVKARIATNPKNLPVEKVKFKTNSGQEVKTEYNPTDREWVLTVQGTLHRQDFSIYPYFLKGDREIVCGKLNVMPLDKKTVNLVLVPLKGVNGSSINTSEIAAYLNNVYSVANKEVKVSLAPSFDHPTASQPLATEHGKLTDYSANQASLIFAYQQANGEPADNTLYLFLSSQPSPSGSSIKGHTPVNRSFGFLFNTLDKRTIAHELGHGYPLALEHGFREASMGNVYNNLMYYNSSTQLSHSQWEMIHQPPVKIRTGQEDKEGQFIEEKKPAEVARFITQIRCGIEKGASTALVHFGWVKYEGIKVAEILAHLNSNGTVASTAFKEAKINVSINAGYVPEIEAGYRDMQLKLPSKDFSLQTGLVLYGKGTFLFTVTAVDMATREAVYNWLLRETGLDGKRQYSQVTVNTTKNWTAEEMFRFSECELEKLSRQNREKLIGYLIAKQETLLLDRDTYQYLLVNVLRTTPRADKPHFFEYFRNRPKTIQALYSALAANQRTKFMACMVEFWQLHYATAQKALDDPDFEYALTTSLFGNIDNKLTFEEGKIWLLPDDPLFAVHPFEPVGIALSKTDGTYTVLPALVGLYMSDKGRLEDLKQGLMLAADMALLAVGVGEVAVALKGIGVAQRTGLASRQFLKASLRLGLGGADMLASMTGTYCGLSPQSQGTFCQTWKRYETFVNLGLLTVSGADLIYNSLSKSYTKEIREALLKKNPKQVEFLEGELGITVSGNEIVIVSGKSIKLSNALKKAYDELLNAGLKAEEKANSILFKNYRNETVVILYENKLTPIKWISAYNASKKGFEQIANLEGYWVFKKDKEVFFDLGFKENRMVRAEEANDYLVNSDRAQKEGQPYLVNSIVEEFEIPIGEKVYVVEYANKGKPKPGGFGSNSPIKNLQELRNKLAVLEAWKDPSVDVIVVREYVVIAPVKTRSGIIGPQLEKTGVDAGKTYNGGAHQYEFVDYLGGESWKKKLNCLDEKGKHLFKK